MPKYIALRGIKAGNVFFTLNRETETPDDARRLSDGTFAYDIVGYGDSIFELHKLLYGPASAEQLRQQAIKFDGKDTKEY